MIDRNDKNEPTPREILDAIGGLSVDLSTKHIENKDRFGDIDRRLNILQRGFPGDDPDGHRRYHDELIAEAAARKQFWMTLGVKLLERGIWAALAGLALSVVFYFRNGLK